MQSNRSMPPTTIIPVLAYEDVGEAVRWLCATLGFEERWRAGNHRAQLWVGDGTIAVTGGGSAGTSDSLDSVMVRVADVDAHHGAPEDWGGTSVRLELQGSG